VRERADVLCVCLCENTLPPIESLGASIRPIRPLTLYIKDLSPIFALFIRPKMGLIRPPTHQQLAEILGFAGTGPKRA